MPRPQKSPRNHTHLLPLLVVGLFATSFARAAQENAAPAAADVLCVMTYNLRYANDNPGEAWSMRRPMMAECIRAIAPDVFGTQEGLYPQLNELTADLPEFTWIGIDRHGGSNDEFCAVFYRTARLEPLAFDHFWLSDTAATMGSATWGNNYARMVTWVRFRDRRTGREFYCWNTHFDHEAQLAREQSAALIRERIAQLQPALPVLLVGDFNAAAGQNKAYEILAGDGAFKDAWTTAAQRRGDGGPGTFNGFGEFPIGDERIDWILTRGAVTVDAAQIVTFSRDGVFPSDHFPMVAWVRLGASD